MELNNFLEYVRQMTDEDLAYIYSKQGEYAEEYIATVEEELIIRGYDPSKFNLWETGQQLLLKQKTDFELLELLNNKKSLYAPDFVRMEIENRQLTEDILSDRYILQGMQGNTVVMIVLAVAGVVIFPVCRIIFRFHSPALSGSVMALIAFIMSAYYCAAYKRLSSGKTVKKYNRKTRGVAEIVLIIMSIIILFNIGLGLMVIL
ncbi:MAG: hypothetical protein LBP63_11440 [Prevotellaceae bacterium]|jgi:hypothetical protein|nr:hypothetical protein [Prevotellaceae bacterium]